MGRAAEMWWLGRDDIPPETATAALDVLDAICEPYRNSDAEFEAGGPDYSDYRDPVAPIGRLLIVAFDVSEEIVASFEDEEDDTWYEVVVQKFRNRYNFC